MTPKWYVSLTMWGLLLTPGVARADSAAAWLTVLWSGQCCGYQSGYGCGPMFPSCGSYYGGGYGACYNGCGNYASYGCGSGCNYGFAPSCGSNFVSYGYDNCNVSCANNCAPACNNNCAVGCNPCGPACGCGNNCAPGCCPNGNCTLNYDANCNDNAPKSTEKKTPQPAPSELPKEDRTFKEKTPDGFGPRADDMPPVDPDQNPGNFVPPKQPANPASAPTPMPPMTPMPPTPEEEEKKKKEAYEKDLNEAEPGLFIHLEQRVTHAIPARHSRMKVRAQFTAPVVARRDQHEKLVDWKPDVQTVNVVHQD